ncbi:cold-shock protein [Burkholderia mayonis]|uniref:Cold-shock protein n=1 Tax=Burkholderia mayonis TaxID=1385591 RepID=A0A1B4FG24_9BURK|nr:cold-shock protein [Burkholderia mayonis]KVE48696.1 cold-shock protein [Burkholderia mayonis]
MARDPDLEALVDDELKFERNLTAKAMFGGWAWLLDGNLLCCARDDGMLVRLGKDNDGWALQRSGIVRMISRGRPMQGWVRVAPEAYGNDALRRRLLDAALECVRSLPPK